MKLSELLASYKGKELTSEMISAISSEVDVIKTSAVDKAVSKFKDYDDLQTELQTFRDEKQKQEFNESWTKAGGKPDAKLDDYNLDNYKKEDGQLDHKALFEAHPNLKADGKTPPEAQTQTGTSSVYSAITALNGQPEGNGGEGDGGVPVY